MISGRVVTAEARMPVVDLAEVRVRFQSRTFDSDLFKLCGAERF